MVRLAQNKYLGLWVIWHQHGRIALNTFLSALRTYTRSKIYIGFLSRIVQLKSVPFAKLFAACVCGYQHAVVDLLHVWLGELNAGPCVAVRRERGVQFLDTCNCSVSIICSYNGSVYEERSALWSYWALWYESNRLVVRSRSRTLGALTCISVVTEVIAQCVCVGVNVSFCIKQLSPPRVK